MPEHLELPIGTARVFYQLSGMQKVVIEQSAGSL